MTSVNGVGYTYDNNGNLLSDGARTFGYDTANRLVLSKVEGLTQVVSGTLTTQYAYSGDGVRLAQTVAGVATRYVVDRGVPLPQVLAENKAGTQTAYLHGLGMIAQYDSGRWAYQHPDALGSVRQLTDAARQVTLARNYTPFGVPLAQSGTAPGSFGYAGEQQDVASGLVFLRARYYDPATGRFLTRDPYPAYATVPSTLHRYAYVGNNPINQVDPSGLQAVPQSGVPSRSLARWRALRQQLASGTGGRIGSPSRTGRLSYRPGQSFSWPSFSYTLQDTQPDGVLPILPPLALQPDTGGGRPCAGGGWHERLYPCPEPGAASTAVRSDGRPGRLVGQIPARWAGGCPVGLGPE